MIDHLRQTADALVTLDRKALDRLLAFVRDCTGTLWLCGNGGSASTAQHWACDLSKAAGRRAVALGSNPALLTAWANDRGYSSALADELRGMMHSKDQLICLSCSGASANIVTVLRVATVAGMSRAVVTGRNPPADPALYEICVAVPSDDYGVIEDCHLAIGHWLTKELRG